MGNKTKNGLLARASKKKTRSRGCPICSFVSFPEREERTRKSCIARAENVQKPEARESYAECS